MFKDLVDGGVLRRAGVDDALGGLLHVRGRLEVRLAHAEREHVDAARSLRREHRVALSQREQLAVHRVGGRVMLALGEVELAALERQAQIGRLKPRLRLGQRGRRKLRT